MRAKKSIFWINALLILIFCLSSCDRLELPFLFSPTTTPIPSSPTPTSTPNPTPTSTPDPSNYKVLYFVSGGLGDTFYFDEILNGIEKAKQEYGFQLEIIESGYGSSQILKAFENALKESNFDFMILSGKDMTFEIQKYAPEFPDRKFIVIDGNPNLVTPRLTNVYNAAFDLNHAAYLAGLYAGYMTTNTELKGINSQKKLGVIAEGLDTNTRITIDYFINGAKAAGIPENNIIVKPIGSFNNLTSKGISNARSISANLYSQGVDIIFQLAGDFGLGIYQSAKAYQRYVIGYKIDQTKWLSFHYPEFINSVLTSSVSFPANAAYQSVVRAMDRTLVYGISENLGVGNSVIGLIKDEHYEAITPEEVKGLLVQAEDDIALKVPRISILLNGTKDTDVYYPQIQQSMEKLMQSYNFNIDYIEVPDEKSDPVQFVDNYIKAHNTSLIVMSGQDKASSLLILAKNYPFNKFVLLNGKIDYSENYLPNTFSTSFNVNEGLYLAGYYAGLMTQDTSVKNINPSKNIGVVGGYDNQVVNNQISAFKLGAIKAGLLTSDVTVGFNGNTIDIENAKGTANYQYSQNGDINLNLAGPAGLGVFQEASDQGLYAIGMDVDEVDRYKNESPEFSNVILTSVYRNEGEALFNILTQFFENTLEWNQQIDLGIASDLVGLVKNSTYESITPSTIKDLINQAESDIADGKIKVIPPIQE